MLDAVLGHVMKEKKLQIMDEELCSHNNKRLGLRRSMLKT